MDKKKKELLGKIKNVRVKEIVEPINTIKNRVKKKGK